MTPPYPKVFPMGHGFGRFPEDLAALLEAASVSSGGPTGMVVPLDAVVIEKGAAEKVWLCEFGSVLCEQPDASGDCKGCRGRQAQRGCGWRVLAEWPTVSGKGRE